MLADIDRGRYRPRSLLPEPVDDGAIRYGSPREALAHRLLGDPAGGAEPMGEVKVTKLHAVVGEGRRSRARSSTGSSSAPSRCAFTLDLEGQVTDAWCNCPTYLRSKLREGPAST
ncbi:MAG: hypothetical protein R3F59_38590 [Myxococcota bacterium]